jgi:hypothetical protein
VKKYHILTCWKKKWSERNIAGKKFFTRDVYLIFFSYTLGIVGNNAIYKSTFVWLIGWKFYSPITFYFLLILSSLIQITPLYWIECRYKSKQWIFIVVIFWLRYSSQYLTDVHCIYFMEQSTPLWFLCKLLENSCSSDNEYTRTYYS